MERQHQHADAAHDCSVRIRNAVPASGLAAFIGAGGYASRQLFSDGFTAATRSEIPLPC